MWSLLEGKNFDQGKNFILFYVWGPVDVNAVI